MSNLPVSVFNPSMMTEESFSRHVLKPKPAHILKPNPVSKRHHFRVLVHPPSFLGETILKLGSQPIPEVISMIRNASPGMSGIEDLKRTTAMRLAASLKSTLSPRTTRSVPETIIRVQQHLQDILLCRPFLTPNVLARANNFIATVSAELQASSPESITEIQKILQQQQSIHEVVHKYGHLAIAPIPDMRGSARLALYKALKSKRKKYPATGSIVDILSESNQAAENMRLHILHLHGALTRKVTIPKTLPDSSQLPQ